MSQRDHLWIGNLPYETTDEDLWQICETVGSVESIELHKDPKTGRSLGWVFCRFSDYESSTVAKQVFSGIPYGGRTLAVEWAANRTGGGAHRELNRVSDMDEAAVQPSAQVVTPAQRLKLHQEIAAMTMDDLSSVVRDIEQLVTEHPTVSNDILQNNPEGWQTFLQARKIILNAAAAPPEEQ